MDRQADGLEQDARSDQPSTSVTGISEDARSCVPAASDFPRLGKSKRGPRKFTALIRLLHCKHPALSRHLILVGVCQSGLEFAYGEPAQAAP